MAVLEDVEPRILFSANTGVLAYVPDTTDAAIVQVAPQAAQTIEAEAAEDAAILVVVDAGLPDVDLLLNELEQRQQSGEPIDWLILDANQDGLEVITSTLASSDDVYSAIHIVTHGDAASFDLGNQQVDLGLLRARASEFASWSESLSSDADLLIYGCDLTSVDAGRSLIDGLSTLTSADVAASNNTTGHASLGGDWTLETQSGSIEASPLLSVQGQAGWVVELTVGVESDPETIVNENTSGRQDLSQSSDRQVATNGTSTVVVWEDDDNIYFRLLNLDGSAQTSATLVANGGVARDLPTVAMANDGSFVIAWVAKDQDGDKDGIYAQRFDASGLAQVPTNRIADSGYVTSSEFRVHISATDDQDEPSVALLADGRMIASWSDNAAGNVTRLALIETDGSITWDTQPIVTSGDQKLGVVSVNPANGQPILVVQHATAANDALSVAMIQTTDGSVQGSVLTIDSPSFDYTEPAISINGATEQMVLAFMGKDGGDERVFFSRIDISGAGGPSLIDAAPVDVTGSSDVDNPDAAFSDLNHIVVVWEDKGSNDVFARQYDGASGLPVGLSTTVNSVTGGGQDVPYVVLHGSTATVIWHGDGPTDNDGIFQRQLELATPGVQVTPSGLTTSESGSTVSFSVVLTSQPTGSVQVQISTSDPGEATLSPGTLSFGQGNWDTPQVVTVMGVADGIADGDQSYSVDYSVDSPQDALYDALPGGTFNMVNLDIDGVTISSVTDDDAAPNIVAENAAAMTDVGITAIATDPPNTVTYAFESPSSLFAIDSNSGVITTLVPLDYETATSHEVIVQATSSGSGLAQTTFTINVVDSNDELPVITPAGTIDVDENVAISTPVTTLTAADADASDTLQNWQVTGGSGAALFALDAVSGQITVNGALDYESATSYTLDVTVDDAANNTSLPVTITISLNDLNDMTPVVTSPGPFNISENSAPGTPVTTLTASDADTADSLQNWTITGGSGASLFAIDAASGQVTVTGSLDHETSASYVIEVTVDDMANNTSAPVAITINLTDLNDEPPVVSSGGPFTVVENAPAGTVVGVATATDADAGDTLQNWQITGGTGAGLFNISPSGQISAVTVMPDYEVGLHSFTLLITVQDANSNTSMPREFTVDLANVVEALTISAPTDVSIDEDTPVSLTGTDGITLVDGENRPELQISISVDRGTFSLSQTTGLTFSVGDGSADSAMSFSGDAVNINQALDALQYTPLTNDNGVANLTTSVSDPSDASRDVSTPTLIAITAVNDTPVVQGSGVIAAQHASSSVIDSAVLNATDVEDSSAALIYTVTTTPEQGVLTLSGTPLEPNENFSQADIEAGLIGYQNTTGMGESDGLVLTVTDSGGAFVADVRLDVILAGAAFAPPPTPDAEDMGDSRANVRDSGEDEQTTSEQAAMLVTTGDEEENRFVPAPPATESVKTNATQGSPDKEQNQTDKANHLTRNPLSDYSGRQFTGSTTEYESWRASDIAGQHSQPDTYRNISTQFVRDFSYADYEQTMSGLREQLATGVRLDSQIVASSFAMSAGLSVGYVFWLLRGGILLSSVIASMPVWRSIDPLPVLASLDMASEADDEDDSLEGMLDDADKNQSNEELEPEAEPVTRQVD